MCEAVDFFRQALAEEGLNGEVTHESDGLSETFYFSKNIAGDTVTYVYDIQKTTTLDRAIEKELAMAAKNISTKYENFVTDTFKWDDRMVSVQLYEEPSALCHVCGAEVSLPQERGTATMVAESSVPHPKPEERGSVIESMDDHSAVCLKMYLLGKLRDNCEPSCNNSRKSDNNRKLYIGEAHS